MFDRGDRRRRRRTRAAATPIAVARVLMASDGRLVLAHVHELSPVRGASGAYGPGEEQESLRLVEAERAATGVDAELVPLTASSVGRGLHYLAEAQEADLLTRRLEPRAASPGAC